MSKKKKANRKHSKCKKQSSSIMKPIISFVIGALISPVWSSVVVQIPCIKKLIEWVVDYLSQ